MSREDNGKFSAKRKRSSSPAPAFSSSSHNNNDRSFNHSGKPSDQPIYTTRAQIGKPAPDFTDVPALVNGFFKSVSLKSFRGRSLIVLFHPEDFTDMCPVEVFALSNRMAEFRDINTDIVVVAGNLEFSNLDWKNADDVIGTVEIPLLSDVTQQIAKDYGVYGEDREGIAVRGLFFVDPTGILRKAVLDVVHSVDEIKSILLALQAVSVTGDADVISDSVVLNHEEDVKEADTYSVALNCDEDELLSATPLQAVSVADDADTDSIALHPNEEQLSSEEVAAATTSTEDVTALPKNVSDHVRYFETDSGEGHFVCLHCRYQTSEQAVMLRDHLPFHLNRSAKHRCPVCSFSADSPETVLAHVDTAVHSSAETLQRGGDCGEVLLQACCCCPFRTPFKAELAEHLPHHVSESYRFHCSMCSFAANEQRTVIQHEAVHFLQRPRLLEGIIKVTRKYQRADDKTPFYLRGDRPNPHPVERVPPLTEEQREELKLRLADIIDTGSFFD
ncbi:putative Peroxiredoxin-4 [Hypsibius exemplaris]|uniref:thioredoxin-dependent peroxiredoxin n=1 Tax=Hypsibius exemplaris TaxID=2072580 RepID=A0A1W0WGL5_HYPEX|nr:putative Peroxiredoxin-4 [Hypsibius exemplaris]